MPAIKKLYPILCCIKYYFKLCLKIASNVRTLSLIYLIPFMHCLPFKGDITITMGDSKITIINLQ